MKRKMSEQTKNANLGVRQRRRKCYGDHRQKDSVLKKEAPWGSNKTVHVYLKHVKPEGGSY